MYHGTRARNAGIDAAPTARARRAEHRMPVGVDAERIFSRWANPRTHPARHAAPGHAPVCINGDACHLHVAPRLRHIERWRGATPRTGNVHAHRAGLHINPKHRRPRRKAILGRQRVDRVHGAGLFTLAAPGTSSQKRGLRDGPGRPDVIAAGEPCANGVSGLRHDLAKPLGKERATINWAVCHSGENAGWSARIPALAPVRPHDPRPDPDRGPRWACPPCPALDPLHLAAGSSRQTNGAAQVSGPVDFWCSTIRA